MASMNHDLHCPRTASTWTGRWKLTTALTLLVVAWLTNSPSAEARLELGEAALDLGAALGCGALIERLLVRLVVQTTRTEPRH